MDQGLYVTFKKLKPICDKVATKASEDNIKELKKLSNELDDHIIQTLHEYVMFPIFANLQSSEIKSNHKLKSLLLETLQDILRRIRLEKLQIFTYLYMALILHIYDKDATNLVANIDEETKLSIISCFVLLFRGLSMDLRYDLYTREQSLKLSQCCLVCTQIAKNEKLRTLRLKSIECLMVMMNVHDDADFCDIELQNKVADVMMSYLPGVTMGLRDVANGDVKQGHKITSLAIKFLKRIIILHMKDTENEEINKIVFQYPLKIEEKVDDNTTLPKIGTLEEMIDRYKNAKRTTKWYKDTENKLKTIIKSLEPLQYHDHPKVRLELSELCEEILINCNRKMNSSVSDLIEILIALSEDDDNDVSKRSRKALNKILNKSGANYKTDPIEIVEENLYNVLTKLPRIMNETDLTKKLNALNLLVGYLRLLGPKHLHTVLQSSSHLKRLVLTLIHVSQLERSNISLFEDHAVRDFESITETPITWKQFTYLNEKDLYNKFYSLLEIISKSDASNILIDQLCDLFANDYENKNECIFLLNELLSVSVPDINRRINLINRVIEMYLIEENWYLPLSVTNDEKTNVSLFNVHNNIIQTCLLVEGIGKMSKTLGDNFKQYLLKVLYFVLERAGNPQPLISAAGLLSLSDISKACKYESVTKLIVDNTDYFSFYVMQRIKRLHRNPQVLDVLNVVMNYSNVDVLPSIMDIINRVLLQSCDKFQEQNSTSFLKVFLSFVYNLKRWLNIDLKKEERIVRLLKEYKTTMDNLYSLYFQEKEFVKEFEKMKTEELILDDFQTDIEEPMEEEYKKPEPPEHIKLTVDILKRSLNFLPSKDRQKKILVIDILKNGIQIISSWEDELLPVVHLIWSPLINRFKEFSDPLIVNRSFELLSVLAMTSKDFIRNRTSKNVFPEICSTLGKLSEQSFLKDRGSAYRYTQAYKLQLNLLQNLSDLISDLEMIIKDVELAMTAVKPYLSNKQPIPLQELAVSFYKNLARYDFDSVWLFLIEIYGSKRQREERACLTDYDKNVENILKTMNLAKW